MRPVSREPRARRTFAGLALALAAVVIVVSVKVATPPYLPQAPGYRTRGPADAPVRLAEFTDLQCPACRMAVAQVKHIEGMFPGKIRLVFKHYPLKGHAWAREAALAAECAGKAGGFWPFHDMLYERQESWGSLGNAQDVRKLLMDYARESGLDEKAIAACMAEPSTAAAVDADLAEARDHWISATPTFFIEGKRFVGPLQLRTYGLNRIDSILKARAARDGRKPG